MLFVDRVGLYVKGGDGGSGCLSFRREKFVPHGGPDGGDGGDGGNVIAQAVAGTDSLAELSNRRHWRAERGRPGQGKNKTGKAGRDLFIPVPPGTIVRDRDNGFILKDLTEPGSHVVLARGGKGGRGNAAFATATHQTPREFEPGQRAEERSIILELKSIADVGLVGLPNAGKSTLLSRITQARPRIADYPFTTKHPNLGICRLDRDRTCVVADIPGLIEGAHQGVGLGHEFLRHVERTRVLVHLVAPLSEAETEASPEAGPSSLEHRYRAIRRELALYASQLAEKREIVVVSKCDVGVTAEEAAEFGERIGQPVLPISAVTGAGLRELMQALATALDSEVRSQDEE